MKKFTLLALSLGFASLAQAGTLEEVQRCYQQSRDDRSASYCANTVLAREVDWLKSGSGGGGNTDDNLVTFVACDNDGDPRLHRYVVDSLGKTIRDDVVQTFTEGSDDDERGACRAEVVNQRVSVPDNFRTQCSCSSDGDPALVLDLMDRRFATLARFPLTVYTAGGDDEERRACANDLARMPLCNIR
ncbi:MAG: hypothetical protein AB7N80_08895 [Bdellovibrionales bacterium]